jgi:hypothetical protein
VSTAQARDNWGAAAAGLVGGVVIGSALSNASRPVYAYPAPAPVYAYPAPTSYTAPPPAPTYYTAPSTTYYTAPSTTTTTTYSYAAPSTVVASNPHVDWCYANRPGYNPVDNTFQPAYGGARERCESPYAR